MLPRERADDILIFFFAWYVDGLYLHFLLLLVPIVLRLGILDDKVLFILENMFVLRLPLNHVPI